MKYLKILVPLSFVVVGFGLVIFFALKRTDNNSGNDTAWIHAKAPTTPAPLLSRLADEAVVQEASGGPGQFSPLCIDHWLKIARTPAAPYLAGLRSQNESLSRNCATEETDIPFAQEVYKVCTLTPEKNFADEKNCSGWYKLYRASIIDKLTAGEKDYSRLTDGLLIAKFVGRMSAGGAPALPELRQMAEEIRKRFPDNPSSYKILASLEVLPERLDPKAGASAAAKGLLLNPADQELQSAWFYFKSQDPDFKYDEFVTAHPDYPYGLYFQAARLWDAGHRETAVVMVANLLLKNPQDQNFQQTMSYLQSNDGDAEGENPFNVHFDLSSDDW